MHSYKTGKIKHQVKVTSRSRDEKIELHKFNRKITQTVLERFGLLMYQIQVKLSSYFQLSTTLYYTAK